MPRKVKRKMARSKPKAKASKRGAKTSARSAARKTSAPAPTISREVIEEILVHSAKSAEGEQLSDAALAEIAAAAGLDPARVLDVHERLCEVADAEAATTVLRVVELWEPDEE